MGITHDTCAVAYAGYIYAYMQFHMHDTYICIYAVAKLSLSRLDISVKFSDFSVKRPHD